jgi:hypothetical protein
MDNKVREILYEIIDALIKWEDDFRNVEVRTINAIIYSMNSMLIKKNCENLPLNIPQFIKFLQSNTLSEVGFNEEEVEKVILNERILLNGRVNEVIKDWYNEIVSILDEEEKAMKEFLLVCRSYRGKEEETKYCNYYQKGRNLINKNNNIISNMEYKKLLQGYFTSDLRNIMVSWRKDITINEEEITICPICGKMIEFGFGQEGRCSDICNYYIKHNKLEFEKIKIQRGRQYSKFTNGIYKYVLLPNIAEDIIYNKLNTFYGIEIEHSPNMDEYDIKINVQGKEILIDVKDVADPGYLVRKLKENNSIRKLQKSRGMERYIVIPEHRRIIYKSNNNGGDYKTELSNIFARDGIDIEVLYEKQLYKKVKELIEDDF